MQIFHPDLGSSAKEPRLEKPATSFYLRSLLEPAYTLRYYFQDNKKRELNRSVEDHINNLTGLIEMELLKTAAWYVTISSLCYHFSR